MARTLRKRGERGRTSEAVCALIGTLLLSSCAAAPFLIPVAIEFARNLVQTSMSNYGSKHRDNISNLVNRLTSPYTQNLPPMAGGGPGMPGQSGYPGQSGVPQQMYSGQQPYLGQPNYPGQQADPGQAGSSDPNTPYGSGGATYPGAGIYPGTMPNQQGAAPTYQSPPAQPGYDPTNPYGSPASNPYGQTNPYGATAPQGMNPYGAAQDAYGNSGNPSQPGVANPYGSPNPYGETSMYPGVQSGQQNPYGAPNQPYGTQAPYGNTAYPPQPDQPNSYGTANPYGGGPVPTPQGGYDPNYPYGNSGAGQGNGQTPSTYGRQHPGYGTALSDGVQQQQPAYGSGYGTTDQPYGNQQHGAAGVLSAEPVTVDVAMVRQKLTDKGKAVVLMNDGEVLRDGGIHQEQGDRFKIVVRTNCDCYLYIMSIDGSGWAEPVYPGREGKSSNPVKKDQEYAFPEGPHWYTLDQVKGIETFFVVASANRRAELEESFAQIAAERRPKATIVAKVEKAPVIPRGAASVTARGIVTVKDDTGTAVQVTPLSYAAAGQAGQDVTVTRWFRHE
jgi:hypothetical protein